MNKTGWRHFEHKADAGIEGRGPDMETAFAQAGLALIAVIADPDSVHPRSTHHIVCNSEDPELLFFDFINEIIFLITSEGMLFSQIDVKITGPELNAQLKGEPINPDRHDPAVEIKGASFNELRVEHKNNNLWVARCIVDV